MMRRSERIEGRLSPTLGSVVETVIRVGEAVVVAIMIGRG